MVFIPPRDQEVHMRSPKRTILLSSMALALTAGSGAAIAATHN
jgi:hypothetical protein